VLLAVIAMQATGAALLLAGQRPVRGA
jgi:hypothetical protein